MHDYGPLPGCVCANTEAQSKGGEDPLLRDRRNPFVPPFRSRTSNPSITTKRQTCGVAFCLETIELSLSFPYPWSGIKPKPIWIPIMISSHRRVGTKEQKPYLDPSAEMLTCSWCNVSDVVASRPQGSYLTGSWICRTAFIGPNQPR